MRSQSKWFGAASNRTVTLVSYGDDITPKGTDRQASRRLLSLRGDKDGELRGSLLLIPEHFHRI